ncbi:hypothetical protein M413DRAFT_25759 [Hebeloma cylindrosporum]|uniref:F-box domain-containing protein n=1 Tax=Hebeloma cylindrosporum TaxID=76867 RepID=A0A0C2Y3C0_HEBCY|nr:hypothetical protein M413DRAFT_25759 [Hebeloma cylindrosporum h7]
MLRISSLSPAYDPDGRWVHPEGEASLEIRMAEEELQGCLFKAITSLKSVQSVEWKPGYNDADWAQNDVMNALKTLPSLRVILLQGPHFKLPPSLHDLSSIQEISASVISVHTSEILDNICKPVARSPKITSIDMTSCSLPPLRLHHLSLEFYRVKLDEVTLPHLKHLMSLNLMCIEEPFGRKRWGSRRTADLSPSEEKQTYGSALDDIWEALKTSLSHLFLASYSGLKKLQLSPGGFDEGDSSDSMASQFFSTPFINHVQSLEHLSISALYEGSWCFGPWNQTIISRYTNLKTLAMAIVSRDVDGEGNMIGLSLDTLSNSMPKLERLIILTADLEDFRNIICAKPSMNYAAYAARAIISRANMYRSLPTCHRLPHLTVDDRPPRTFIPLGPNVSGCLYYTDTNPPSALDDDRFPA